MDTDLGHGFWREKSQVMAALNASPQLGQRGGAEPFISSMLGLAMPKAKIGHISRATLRTQLAAANRFSFIGFGARELFKTIMNDAQISKGF